MVDIIGGFASYETCISLSKKEYVQMQNTSMKPVKYLT